MDSFLKNQNWSFPLDTKSVKLQLETKPPQESAALLGSILARQPDNY